MDKVMTLEMFYDILKRCGNDTVEALYEIKSVLEPEEMANANNV